MTKIFAAALLVITALAAQASNNSAAVVLATNGTVTIQRGGAALPATRKSTLVEHDEIHTGDNARAQLRFADGTVTTLGANTIFVIKTYQWKSDNKQEADAGFQLVQGAFRTVTGHILDAQGSRFNVTTPVGVIGIRGTDFWGGYLDGDNVDVLLIDGKHAVTISNKSGTVILNKPGEGTTLRADQGAPAVKVWPKEKVGRAVATIAWPADAKEQPE
ncbi:MAG TPA: FecR family protein [Pseudomonadales bacterium]|nr:FecR family protein [Pseudomonadales bacterium]